MTCSAKKSAEPVSEDRQSRIGVLSTTPETDVQVAPVYIRNASMKCVPTTPIRPDGHTTCRQRDQRDDATLSNPPAPHLFGPAPPADGELCEALQTGKPPRVRRASCHLGCGELTELAGRDGSLEPPWGVLPSPVVVDDQQAVRGISGGEHGLA